jgi:hypothetical protein
MRSGAVSTAHSCWLQAPQQLQRGRGPDFSLLSKITLLMRARLPALRPLWVPRTADDDDPPPSLVDADDTPPPLVFPSPTRYRCLGFTEVKKEDALVGTCQI